MVSTLRLQLEKLLHEPDDHIGLELAFVAHLLGAAASAYEQGNGEEYERMLEAQRDLLDVHLPKWASVFCDGLIEKSRTDNFCGIAFAIKGALKEATSLLTAHTEKSEM